MALIGPTIARNLRMGIDRRPKYRSLSAIHATALIRKQKWRLSFKFIII